MRLDADKGHRAFVWDCERSEQVRNVLWVDDSTHEYCVWASLPSKALNLETLRARKISITRAHDSIQHLVLINPKEESGDAEHGEAATVVPASPEVITT